MTATGQRQPAIRSDALRRSAAGETCTLRLPGCQGRHGVVLAHIRTPGTGVGRKPGDLEAVFACHTCHDLLDGRAPLPLHVPGEDIPTATMHALLRTHHRMWQRGLITVADAPPPITDEETSP
jgi:hypothetical protein